MMRTRKLVVVVAAVALIAAACTGDDDDTTAGGTETTASGGETDGGTEECTSEVSGDMDECEYGPEFAEEWADLVEAAQEEGTLAVVSGPGVDDDEPWFEAFVEYFDLELTHFGGATADVTARVAADRELGDYGFDIANQGGTGTRNFIDAGWLEPALPYMIHPDFENKEAWYEGATTEEFPLPWATPEEEFCFFYGVEAETQMAALWYNTETVSEEEVENLESWNDLLDERWQGRIVIGDVGGGEAGADRALLWWTLGEEWFDTLFREQDPTIVPYGSAREHADILVRGDADFGIFPPGDDSLEEAAEQGLPVSVFDHHTLEEGAPRELSQRNCIMKDAPNPNVAQLFMNWIFTYEGGRLFNEESARVNRASIRTDVPQGNVSDEAMAAINDDNNPFVDERNPELVEAREESEEWLQDIYEELNIVPGG